MLIKRKGYITNSSIQVNEIMSNKQLYLSHMIVKQEMTDNITYKTVASQSRSEVNIQ